MFKKIFKTKKEENPKNGNIFIMSLLIHAAKIDEKYTENEKIIIKNAMINLKNLTIVEAEELLKLAEKKITGTRIEINESLHESFSEELQNYLRFFL